jgi:hypothetical protein
VSKGITELRRLYKNHEELTIAERELMNVGSIKLNSVKCVMCSDVLISENRHDFKWCRCKSVAVDGGSWYLKRTFKDKNHYIEMSERYADEI